MKKEDVLKQFDQGYDCGQVVFGYWAKQLGLDEETAYKISSGFGAGMYQGETCGAIIGAYMAIGQPVQISQPNVFFSAEERNRARCRQKGRHDHCMISQVSSA